MRSKYEAYYRKARANLLLMAVLTVVNMVLLLADASISFPFSAVFPQLAVVLGSEFTEVFGSTAMVIGAVMGVASAGLYFLCWALSKHHPGAIIAALVLFSLDCVSLILCFELVSMIVEILFHVWVMVYLVLGTVAVAKLRHLPPEEAVPVVPANGMPLPQPTMQPPYTAQPQPGFPAAQPGAPAPGEQPMPAAQPVMTAPAAQPGAPAPGEQPMPAAQPVMPEVQPVMAAPAVQPSPAAEAAPLPGNAEEKPADDGRLPADFPSRPL